MSESGDNHEAEHRHGQRSARRRDGRSMHQRPMDLKARNSSPQFGCRVAGNPSRNPTIVPLRALWSVGVESCARKSAIKGRAPLGTDGIWEGRLRCRSPQRPAVSAVAIGARSPLLCCCCAYPGTAAMTARCDLGSDKVLGMNTSSWQPNDPVVLSSHLVSPNATHPPCPVLSRSNPIPCHSDLPIVDTHSSS